MVQEILQSLAEQGILGGLLVLALIAVGRLYLKNQELWKCMLELQQERLTDTKQQSEYVNSFRECMESVVTALQDSRGANGESISP